MCGRGSERWRELMDATRAVAVELVDEGVVDITQRGEKVDAMNEPIRGPIRLRLAEKRDARFTETDASVGTFQPSSHTGDEAMKGGVTCVGRPPDTKAHRRVRKGISLPRDANAKRRMTRRDA